MPQLTRWESLIHQGGRKTGPVVGAVTTLLVAPRWLRFLSPHAFVTVTGLDDVEAWVRGARSVAQASAVHEALVATYQEKARVMALSSQGAGSPQTRSAV